jgi:hypothetical protein
MKFAARGACLSAVLAIVLLVAAPSSSAARKKTCKTPAGWTIVERTSSAVVFYRPTGIPRNELTTFYGCARGVGKRFFVFKCDPGQSTVDLLQSVRVKNKVAILEFERRTEGATEFFHVTRRVSLRTGKRRDTRSASRQQPPGTPLIYDC